MGLSWKARRPRRGRNARWSRPGRFGCDPDSGRGQPVIVFVEQQTTGGYPVIGNVIAADLASVGQLRPRDVVEFERVSHQRARALLLERESCLESDRLLLT